MTAIHGLKQILRLFRRAYLPGPFNKAYAVAIGYGGAIGGFAGGIVAAGIADGQYIWVIVVSVIVGAVVGAFLALQFVPNKQEK